MALSILDPGPSAPKPPTPWQTVKRYVGDATERGPWFGIGCYAGIILTAFSSDMRDDSLIKLPFFCLGLAIGAFAGGAAGDWLGSRFQMLRDDLSYDEPRRRRLVRRALLMAGVLLFVVNILPEYRRDFRDTDGYYAWSTASSVLAGIGAVFVILAFVSKNENEDF